MSEDSRDKADGSIGERRHRSSNISALRELVALDPANIQALQDLGLELYQDGDNEGARKCFDAALALDGNSFYARLGSVLVTDEAAGAESAEHQYRALLQDYPDSVLVLDFFGDFLARAGRSEEAISVFQGALRVDSAHVPTLRNYANLLSSLDRDEEAEEHFLRALALASDGASTRYAYGRFLAQFEGRDAEALTQLRMAEQGGEARAADLIRQLATSAARRR